MKTKTSFLRRASSLVLALLLLAGLLCPTAAFAVDTAPTESSSPNTVTISSVEEFLAFAENCRVDAWSKGLTVILERDIDLLGSGFEGIASFSGTFQGGHHTISNLNLTRGDGSIGLIRYLEQEGTVENLNVQGLVKSTESSNILGGIVGINAGTVTGCTFSGTIKASGMAGGIVGMNGASGAVTLCSNTGSVTSQNTVGGIAGHNFGAVTDCTNLGTVNSDSSWVDGSEGNDEPSLDSLTNLADGRDIGGIVGRNSGVIVSCRSNGTVGYKRSGQNVGGIAGFTSGDIIACTHDGKVFGKQNVGGIAGHVEPFIQPEDSESLRAEVDTLHDLINTAVDDLDTLTSGIHTNMDELTGRADSASDTAKALSDELVDVVNRNIDVVNDLSDRVDYVSRHLPAVFDQVDIALDSLKMVNDDLKKVKDDLDIKEKLEDSTYDPAAHERVALQSSVGGTLSVDNRNPAQGVSVTVTAKPDTGYALSRLYYRPYQGTEAAVTPSGENEYTFEMPEENVCVRAEFVYVGGYIVSSNAGGRLTLAESDTQLRIRAAADSGYQFRQVTIGEENLPVAMEADGDSFTAVLNKADYPVPANGMSVPIRGEFERITGDYTITVRSSTGGTAYADLREANSGDTVTLTVNSAENYHVSSILLNNVPTAMTPEGEKKYTFPMPAADTVVDVLFAYQPDSDTMVYAQSTAGGTVRLVQIPATNDYQVILVPAGGFTAANPALKIYSSGEAAPARIVSEDDLSNNSYTLNSGNYMAPIRVEAFFREVNAAAPSVAISASSSTGGLLAADCSTAKAGDTVNLAVQNLPHYRLVSLVANDEDITDRVTDSHCEYEIPSGSARLHFTAQFAPVTVAFETISGCGQARYQVEGSEVVLTVTPSTGYGLDAIAVTASGNSLPVQKQYANLDVYRFPADFAGTALCRLTFVPQSDKTTVDDAKDRMEGNADEAADAADRASGIIEDIEDLLTDEFGEPKDPGDLTADEAEQLEQNILDLLDALGDAAAAAGQLAKDAGVISRILAPYLEDSLDALDEDLDQVNTHIDEMTTALQSAADETRSIVDYLNSLKKLEAVKFSENFSKNRDKLSEDVHAMLDIMRKMNDTLNLDSDRLEADLRKINDQLDKVLGMILDRLEDLESMSQGEDVWEDCSVSDSADQPQATRLLQCLNQGLVDGNTSVGGIAGNVQAEIRELDRDKVSIGRRFRAAALLENCSNQGLVEVKKGSGGGIVGNLALGLVRGCVSGGGVFGTDADYLGGIAGKSRGTLQGCGSLAQIEGNQYLGGIAGCGDKIHDCLSMATIPVFGGRVGAIAGADIPDDEEDETLYRLTLRGRITGNRYVSSSLYGIDGISYLGMAEPLTYPEMIALEGVPTQFLHLQVLFVDEENRIIQRTQLPYGASLEELNYPKLSTDESSYVAWSKPTTTALESSLVLRADTTANVTILPSVQKLLGKPLAFAEGVFTQDDLLEVTAGDLPAPGGLPANAQVNLYTLRLSNTGLTENSVTRIRLLQQISGTAAVLVLRNGDWEELPSRQIGQYLEAEMLGHSESFCVVVTPKNGPELLWCAGSALAVILLVGCLLLVRRRKRRYSQI